MDDLGDFIGFDAFFPGGGSSGSKGRRSYWKPRFNDKGNPEGGDWDGCLLLILFIIVIGIFWYICW